MSCRGAAMSGAAAASGARLYVGKGVQTNAHHHFKRNRAIFSGVALHNMCHQGALHKCLYMWALATASTRRIFRVRAQADSRWLRRGFVDLRAVLLLRRAPGASKRRLKPSSSPWRPAITRASARPLGIGGDVGRGNEESSGRCWPMAIIEKPLAFELVGGIKAPLAKEAIWRAAGLSAPHGRCWHDGIIVYL